MTLDIFSTINGNIWIIIGQYIGLDESFSKLSLLNSAIYSHFKKWNDEKILEIFVPVSIKHYFDQSKLLNYTAFKKHVESYSIKLVQTAIKYFKPLLIQGENYMIKIFQPENIEFWYDCNKKYITSYDPKKPEDVVNGGPCPAIISNIPLFFLFSIPLEDQKLNITCTIDDITDFNFNPEIDMIYINFWDEKNDVDISLTIYDEYFICYANAQNTDELVTITSDNLNIRNENLIISIAKIIY
jgi:hypothetical protein